jgi:hypothetical protein
VREVRVIGERCLGSETRLCSGKSSMFHKRVSVHALMPRQHHVLSLRFSEDYRKSIDSIKPYVSLL